MTAPEEDTFSLLTVAEGKTSNEANVDVRLLVLIILDVPFVMIVCPYEVLFTNSNDLPSTVLPDVFAN